MTGIAQKDLGSPNASAQRVARPAGVPIRITPAVLNADAYDAGDVFFDFTELALAVDQLGGAAVIDQIAIYDKGDQTAAAMTLVVSSNSTSLGTKDSAPNESDANVVGTAAGLGLKPVAVASTDFVDLGGIKVAVKSDLKLVVNADPASQSLWLAALTGGTPTQSTGDIVIDVWVH